ncbi:hypothetical protein [Solibacillus sp. FSL H8-0538]|uniref:hypothetical protein n=1 Tax=Solibacillus sp. FSL H8-0538 TaxID=2921400 RepID=UPI0030FA05B5
MKKENRNKSTLDQVEFGSDLSPDDLDVREENDLTKEQIKNSSDVKQQNKNNSLKK